MRQKNGQCGTEGRSSGNRGSGAYPPEGKSLVTVSLRENACNGGLSLQVVEFEAGQIISKLHETRLYLPLGAAQRSPSSSRRNVAVQSSPSGGLSHLHAQARILRSALEGSASPHILFGQSDDPLYPFEGRFHQSLALLEQMTHPNVERILIQTRSPLILLAMPVLLGLRDRLSVRIGLEALDDAANEAYTPGLPRPSERIKAARALTRLGIRTEIQLSPLCSTYSHHPDTLFARVDELAELIAEMGTSARLVSIGSILPERRIPKHLTPDHPGPYDSETGHFGEALAPNFAFEKSLEHIERQASRFFQQLEARGANVERRFQPQAHGRIYGEVAA